MDSEDVKWNKLECTGTICCQ